MPPFSGLSSGTGPIDGQEMAHDRPFRTGVIGENLALQIGIGIGDPLVLAKMFRPGFDHEPFDQFFRIGRVFRHAPAIGTITAALLGEFIESMQEGGTVVLFDMVFDEDQHGSTVVGDGFCNKRLGPVVGRDHVRIAGGQFQAVHDQAGDQQSGGADQQRALNACSFTHGTPADAACRHRAVEDGEVDGKAAATHPVGQDRLGSAIERRQCGDPGGKRAE